MRAFGVTALAFVLARVLACPAAFAGEAELSGEFAAAEKTVVSDETVIAEKTVTVASNETVVLEDVLEEPQGSRSKLSEEADAMPDVTLMLEAVQEAFRSPETIPSAGFSAQSENAPEDTEDTGGSGDSGNDRVYLNIDTAHTYENMDTSYSQGYIPRVENGVVRLVVPFLASGPLRGDSLTVELEMGEGAPFVYANYRKEVPGRAYEFGEFGKTPVNAYVFCCDIVLEEKRKNGKYPVTVRAVGYSAAGRRTELRSRIFITISDAATDPGSQEPLPGQTDPSGSEQPPGQADSPGTEQPPGQTDPSGTEQPPSQTNPPGTEQPPSQTNPPGTEQPPGQTDPSEPDTDEPSIILPDDPGETGDSSETGDGNGGPDGQSETEQLDTGEPGTEEPNTEKSNTEESNTEEPNTEEAGTEEPSTEGTDTGGGLSGASGGGGYSGGGYADGDSYAGSDAERIHRQPKFLLISDSLDGKQLTAGQEYEFTTVFQNMTGSEPVYNLKITLKSEAEGIDFSCSSFYFGKVRTQETVSLPTFLAVKTNAQAGRATATFTFEYENDQGTSYTAEEEVELEIYQPSQVLLDGFRLSPQVYSTDTVDSSFAVHNTGKAAVYNVQVEFSGQGLFSTGAVFAGNLEAGASYEGELRIYVGNKAMKGLSDAEISGGSNENDVEQNGNDAGEHGNGADQNGNGTDKNGNGADQNRNNIDQNRNDADEEENAADSGELYGQATGILTLTYEDADGETHTQTQEYITEILEPQIVKLSVEKPEEQTNQWQTAILALIGIAFLLTFVFMGWRLRRSRNALEDLLAAQNEKNARESLLAAQRERNALEDLLAAQNEKNARESLLAAQRERNARESLLAAQNEKNALEDLLATQRERKQ